MAYTAPSVADFRTRYPEFTVAIADNTRVQYWLDDALRFVDQSWLERDYAPAMMAYAAHRLAMSRADSNISAMASQGVTDFKSGAFSVSFGEAKTGGGFNATLYGQEYLAMLRVNRGSTRLVDANA